jgi:CubicO group peptidase (beta-lactamase class C family)
MKLTINIGVFLCIFGFSVSGLTAELTLDPDTDSERLPPTISLGSAGALTWKGNQQITAFRNIDKIAPTRDIKSGDYVLALPERNLDLSDVQFSDGATNITVNEYFARNRVAGLIAVKDGNIIYERYGFGNDQDTLWVSFSIAKSVVALLYGAAIKDGYIFSVDEKVTDYLPRLKGSAYQDTTIRNLLQMASGVQWNEDYADPNSDISSASWQTLDLYKFLQNKPRVADAGDQFNYNTAETNLAGTLLRSAIGNNLSNYLSAKIWEPFGMEADANWQLTESNGGEFGGCCISATLRDYARIGLFALANGVLKDGTEVLPKQWMEESTEPSKGYDGYGHFWWLSPDGTYQALGIFGQAIYINEAENVVIAIQSAWEHPDLEQDWALQETMFNAMVDAMTTNAKP